MQGWNAHLHANKLGDLAVLCLDGRHGEKVPEGRPIPFVIEQAHRAALPLFDCIPDDSHLLRIRPFPLQEAAAQAKGPSQIRSLLICQTIHGWHADVIAT